MGVATAAPKLYLGGMDELACKCGARTYEAHLKSGQPGHAFKPNKASSQIRK